MEAANDPDRGVAGLNLTEVYANQAPDLPLPPSTRPVAALSVTLPWFVPASPPTPRFPCHRDITQPEHGG